MSTKKMTKKQSRPKKTYTPEFRAEVVARCQAMGSPTKVTEELGIPASSVYSWINHSAQGGQASAALGDDERRELDELRRENKKLSKDCEILRHAVGHFAKRSML